MVERIEEVKKEKEEPKVSIQEVPINMELLNSKLNYLINLLEKD